MAHVPRQPYSTTGTALLQDGDEAKDEWGSSSRGSNPRICGGLGTPRPNCRGRGCSPAKGEITGVVSERHRLSGQSEDRTGSYRWRGGGFTDRKARSPARSEG